MGWLLWLPGNVMVAVFLLPNCFGVTLGVGVNVISTIAFTVATSVLIRDVIVSFTVNVPYKPSFTTTGAMVFPAAFIKNVSIIVSHGLMV